VLSLVLVLLLVWFSVSVVLAAWTLFLQGYVYSEPVEHVFWRAPAAGAVLTLFLAFWVALACKHPGRYEVLSEFSATQTEKPFKKLIAVIEGKEESFDMRHGADGRLQYRRGNKVMPSRPEKVIALEENGQRTIFAPDLDAAGHFMVDPNRGLRYWDSSRKRSMEEGFLGQCETFRPSWLFANLVINFAHLLAWFLCLWLLLHFQWSHALGQALAFWLLTMLFVVPPLLDRAAKFAGPASPGS
jgi:hypothetical protein